MQQVFFIRFCFRGQRAKYFQSLHLLAQFFSNKFFRASFSFFPGRLRATKSISLQTFHFLQRFRLTQYIRVIVIIKFKKVFKDKYTSAVFCIIFTLFPGDSWPSVLTVLFFWRESLWTNFWGNCFRFRNQPSSDKAVVNFLNLCNSPHSLQQVHLCYVGGQTTPLQLHLAIICSPGWTS